MRVIRVTSRARSISSSVAVTSLCTFIKEDGEANLMYFPHVIQILLCSFVQAVSLAMMLKRYRYV
jgi:hypothetical protein